MALFHFIYYCLLFFSSSFKFRYTYLAYSFPTDMTEQLKCHYQFNSYKNFVTTKTAKSIKVQYNVTTMINIRPVSNFNLENLKQQ
ncbi:hypothetical protein BDA99DRAFT_500945 [Phascolomyces articulosus]|uniref:Uncharacterized protein n=1 Tax=Phascolomyces articulosus TaxID=60185 RepID=A0AAD5K6M8_9FUNG|nr:hypothetical protein BDA99DRAFT_500945 [Phascolomyces articulosus]